MKDIRISLSQYLKMANTLLPGRNVPFRLDYVKYSIAAPDQLSYSLRLKSKSIIENSHTIFILYNKFTYSSYNIFMTFDTKSLVRTALDVKNK